MTDALQPELLPCLSEGEMAELERLLTDATPGPWEPQPMRESVIGPQSTHFPHENSTMNRLHVCGETAAADGELIAAMRNALPALLAMARRSVPSEAETNAEIMAAEAGQLAELVDGFLQCPEIADCAPEDKDPETHELERRARAILGGDSSRSVPERGGDVRAKALDEAAKVAESIWDNGQQGAHGGEQANRTARAIRALKGDD